MLVMIIYTMFAIVTMMRLTGVEISNMPKLQNKQQFWKVSKHCKSQIHTVRNVWNDDLNNVHHGENERSSNFE